MSAHQPELIESSYAIAATNRTLFPAAVALQGLLARNCLNSHLLPENIATEQLDQPAIDWLQGVGMQALVIVGHTNRQGLPDNDSAYALRKLGQNYPEGIRIVSVDHPASFILQPYASITPSCEGLTLVAPEAELIDPVLASVLAGRTMITAV